MNPGGQVIGWQQVPAPGSPAGMHTSPVGQVMHVMLGSPHPGLTWRHDGALTVVHDSGLQQLPSPRHVSPAPQAPELHVSTVPEQGSLYVPHLFAGHAVSGVQQVWPSVVEHCSPAVQFVEQSRTVPVQGSVFFPQKPAWHVSGVQQTLLSPPETPHCCPAVQELVQVKTVPLHGSVYVPPHWLAGQPVAGVQQALVSPPETPHTSPPVQVLEQVNIAPLHGSVYVPPHWVEGHPVAGVQHFVLLHVSVPEQLQVSIVPVHGSATVPQKPAGQVFGVQH